MTPTAPVAKDMTPGTAPGPVRLPPEERFWKHYSPHHEFPLSSVTSAALHALAIVLLLLSAWVAWKLGFGEFDKPVPISAVAIEDPGGGGGSPNGVGDGPNHRDKAPAEDTGNPDKPKPPTPAVNLPDLPVGDVDPVQLPDYKDSTTGQRVIDRGNKVLEQLGKIDREAREKMFSGLGKGGTGTGGGDGHGNGPGTGDGQGPGNGGLTKRQKRQLRWFMDFKFHDESEYLRQLQNIKPGSGAILAYPTPDGHQYRVIRDLSKRPAVGQVEDLRKLKCIFWLDDRRDSVARLAGALQLPAPTHFVAFFPRELEAELARIEHEYKNLDEDQIDRTVFEVVPTADGYHARVTDQSAKP
jgi:hypothetical protein